MILIISEPKDVSTNDVIEWLIYEKKPFIRVNPDSKICVKHIEITSQDTRCLLSIEGVNLYLSDVTGVWFRRGQINLDYRSSFTDILDKTIQAGIQSHLSFELKTLHDLIYYFFKTGSAYMLGDFHLRHSNKVINLLKALEAGLEIPNTSISDNHGCLSDLAKNGSLITKGIQTNLSAFHINIPYYYMTSEVATIDINADLNTKFFPTLVQRKIEKIYEIRTFYIKGKCYSTAIFSQNDSSTSIDYRNYNIVRPNRFIPYSLPDEIEDKLCKFMASTGLDTGSIDLIFTTDQKYIFLEVNPVGQYGGMVSIPGNYYLDKLIAQELSH
jgi:ATP-GRASP peptide maturase of grasp-with-spasm system